jgi:surface antigen
MRGTSTLILLISFLAIVSTVSYAQSFSGLDMSGLFGVRLSNHDLKAMAAAAQPLLDDDSLALGTSRDWSNPESGDHGTIQLQKRFEYTYEGNKLPCRELRYHVQTTGNADPYNFKLDRCKAADGAWKIL